MKNLSHNPCGIRPGNRGKRGRSWFGSSLRAMACHRAKGICHQFLWPESCPAGVTKSGTARRGAIRNRGRAQSGPGNVSVPVPMQSPRGYPVATARPARQGSAGWLKGCQKAQASREAGRVTVDRLSGSGRAWQCPQNLLIGAARKNVSPNCESKGNLRDKRSDP
jgi:hypothetical protein